ncbi:transposase [bacterium]|nr:transposase [bacterium]
MRAYSNDLRQKVVDTYEAGGISQRQLAKRFCVSLNFVASLLRRYRQTGQVDPKPRPGRQSLLSDEQLEIIEELIEQQSDATLDELCDQLEAKIGVRVSRTTMFRSLEKLKLHRKKILSPDSKRKRASPAG